MKHRNRYLELSQIAIQAQQSFHAYKKTCAEVVLDAPGSEFWNRHFQQVMDYTFPEVVSSYRFSDGCMDYMTLIAPPDDIVSALELCLEKFAHTKMPSSYKAAVESLLPQVEVGKKVYLFPEHKRGF